MDAFYCPDNIAKSSGLAEADPLDRTLPGCAGAGVGSVDVVVDIDDFDGDFAGACQRECPGRIDQDNQACPGANFSDFGQTANFLAGSEIPIPSIDDEGNVGVTFREIGVVLNFTPTVVDNDIINLVLDSQVSAVDSGAAATNIGGALIPSITTRRAATTVELRDGQSFAIAGILQDDFSDSINQVPLLGDLPILGALFRSAGYRRQQTELVIIVTAHLVHPTSGSALAVPTERIRPPTENELFLYGRTVGGTPQAQVSTRGGDAAAQDFSGNYGYVME